MPSFTAFRPSTKIGTLYGGSVFLVALALGVGFLYRGLKLEPSFGQFWPLLASVFFLCIAALYGYWTWGCSSLTYFVDRNALSIRWGSVRQVVPLANIQGLIKAEDDEVVNIEGINWTGHHIGRAHVDDLGEVLFYSTHRTMGEVIYVQTPDETYAISVPDHIFFAQTVQSNQSRGPLFEQRQSVHRWGIAAQSFWFDGTARLLSLGLVISFFVVLGYVLHIYPGLDQSVPLRFPSLGGFVRVSDKSEMLDIPRSAAAMLGFNLLLAAVLHSWERMVGYVLLLGGIALQVMLLVAAIVAVA